MGDWVVIDAPFLSTTETSLVAALTAQFCPHESPRFALRPISSDLLQLDWILQGLSTQPDGVQEGVTFGEN